MYTTFLFFISRDSNIYDDDKDDADNNKKKGRYCLRTLYNLFFCCNLKSTFYETKFKKNWKQSQEITFRQIPSSTVVHLTTLLSNIIESHHDRRRRIPVSLN